MPAKMVVKRYGLAVCPVKGDDLDKGVLASFQSPNRAMKQPLECWHCMRHIICVIHDTDDDMTSEAEDSSLDDMDFWDSPDEDEGIDDLPDPEDLENLIGNFYYKIYSPS